jgi:hypothetical protein
MPALTYAYGATIGIGGIFGYLAKYVPSRLANIKSGPDWLAQRSRLRGCRAACT